MTAVQLPLLDLGVDPKLRDADEWRRVNPAAWRAVVSWAYEDAAHNRTCAMQRYIEFLRDPAMLPGHYLHRTDEPYLLNHNLRSALTRLVLMEHPQLPFRIRRSKVDAGATHATPAVMPR